MIDNDKLLEKIGEIIKPLQEGQKRLEQGQKNLEKGQAQQATALEALADRVHDVDEQTATKLDIEGARADILAAVHTLTARLVRQVQSHERRLNNAGIPNPDKH